MDINKALRTAVMSGKVYIGTRQTKKVLKTTQPKLIIFASNIDRKQFEDLKNLQGVPTYTFPGTNQELGSACGKPFPVSVLSIVDPGNSNIMALLKEK